MLAIFGAFTASSNVCATFNSPNCDPISFVVEGRATRTGAWTIIGSGDLPWKDAALSRNARGQLITSAPDSGDR